MQITPTRLPEVLEITPRRFGDDRGFFSESWNRDTWAAAGIDRQPALWPMGCGGTFGRERQAAFGAQGFCTRISHPKTGYAFPL